MSLRSKLLWVLWLSFALLLVALVYLQFSSNREYLRLQQQGAVVNAMNSLSIELAPYLRENDEVGIETVLNAFFDGGLYQRVTLEQFTGDKLYVKENSPRIDSVPGWFQDLQLYPPVQQTQLISSGWIQLGEVTVTGHTGFAVRQLWQQTGQQILLCLVAFLACGLFLTLGLKRLLAHFGSLQHQVEAVNKQEQITPLAVPDQPELQPAFKAVNELNQWVQLKQQEGERLKQQAFQDTVSGLGNRAWMASKLQTWCDQDGRGAIVLLEVTGLDHLYQSQGYTARDQMVVEISKMLTRIVSEWPDALVARIANSEFGMLLPNIGHDQLEATTTRILQQVSRLQGTVTDPAYIGAAQRMHEQSLTSLLSMVDSALRQARTDPNQMCILSTVAPGEDFSRSDWRDLIHEAINSEELVLLAQRVMDVEQKTLHQEVFVNIEHQGVRYTAGKFIPAVEQFDLGRELDQRVLTLVERVLKDESQPDVRLVVNLTCSSLRDPGFHEWVKEFMQRNHAYRERLLFEIPEMALINYRKQIRDFSILCHEQGFSLGIDQVGHNLDAIDEIELIQPSYIKLDPAITRMVSENEGQHAMLRAFIAGAKKLNIVTIATRVEDEKMLEKLLGIDIEAVQGFIRPPELIPVPVERS